MDREEALALFFTEEDAGIASEDDIDHVSCEETSDEDSDDDLLDIRLPYRKKTPVSCTSIQNVPVAPQTTNPDNIVDYFDGINYETLFYSPISNEWY